MRYVLSWSGGKDSTASIILAHLHEIPLDTIVFCEVMYDKKKEISGELSLHMDFITKHAKPVFESWGYEVLILRSDTDYLDFFNRVITNAKKHTDHNGKRFGFPCVGLCGIKRDLKMRPIHDYLHSIDEPVTQYVGIASDERKRLISLGKDPKRVSILDRFGYTGEMARTLCEEHGLLSPLYELTDRGGCWFCPYAKLSELKEFQREYPKEWDAFVALEKKEDLAFHRWNVYREPLSVIDRIIKDM